MAIHSNILARKFRGERSLAGYSPQGRKKSDVTEQSRVTTHLQRNSKYRLYRLSGSLKKIKNKTVKSLRHTLNGSNAYLSNFP